MNGAGEVGASLHLLCIPAEVSAPSSAIHGGITPVMPLTRKTLPIYFTFASNHRYAALAWQMQRECSDLQLGQLLPGGQGGGGIRRVRRRGRGRGGEGEAEEEE